MKKAFLLLVGLFCAANVLAIPISAGSHGHGYGDITSGDEHDIERECRQHVQERDDAGRLIASYSQRFKGCEAIKLATLKASFHKHQPVAVFFEHPTVAMWFGTVFVGFFGFLGFFWPMKPSSTPSADKLMDKEETC